MDNLNKEKDNEESFNHAYPHTAFDRDLHVLPNANVLAASVNDVVRIRETIRRLNEHVAGTNDVNLITISKWTDDLFVIMLNPTLMFPFCRGDLFRYIEKENCLEIGRMRRQNLTFITLPRVSGISHAQANALLCCAQEITLGRVSFVDFSTESEEKEKPWLWNDSSTTDSSSSSDSSGTTEDEGAETSEDGNDDSESDSMELSFGSLSVKWKGASKKETPKSK